MNPIADLLTRAKARTLAFPCRGAAARDAYGKTVHSSCPSVVYVCSYTAVWKETDDTKLFIAACDILDLAAQRVSESSAGASIINDERPDLIPQMFDLAIKEVSK